MQRGLEFAASLPRIDLRTPAWQPVIFRKRVEASETVRPGDLAAVYGPEKELLGYGIVNPRSEAAVRMLCWAPEVPDEAFWNARLEGAVAMRRDLLQIDSVSSACRLIHAEGDGLSGLVVDRYGEVLSAECFSLGMYQRSVAILDRLAKLCGTRHHLVRCSPQFLSQEGFDPPEISSPERPRQTIVSEFGTQFCVRFAGGHKTGFFCDQRENRRMLAGFCGGKTVLDLCCYTGGFSIQAARLGNAAEVTGVDLDEGPLENARENARINRVQKQAKFVHADVFPYMRDMLRSGRKFDVVVLDPPKLIRNRQEIEEGARKHFDLNRLAMQLVKPGGLLLSCTCSGLLGEEEFQKLIAAAARQSGPPLTPAAGQGETQAVPVRHGPRRLRILGRTGAAPDHPVAGNCPEGEYLKAFWLTLE